MGNGRGPDTQRYTGCTATGSLAFWRLLQRACLVTLNVAIVHTAVAAGEDASVLRGQAEMSFNTGDLPAALELFSKVIEMEPNNERNFYKRFRVYLKKSR